MNFDQFVNLIVGVATLAVAIVAIWGDLIKTQLCLGPKLVLALHDPSGELINITSEGTALTPTRYDHLKVSNKNRWSQASIARIVLTGLTKPAAGGSLRSQPLSGPL